MSHFDDREQLCINAEKVYDWVLLQNDVTSTIATTTLEELAIFPFDPTVSNLRSRCFLVDADGEPLLPGAVLDVTETSERDDRDFVIDGELVTLQRVSFTKTLNVVVEFTGILGTTPFVEVTGPIVVTVPESVFLCAPRGTRIVVRLSDFECAVSLNPDTETAEVALNLCQSVQSVADVTLELEAGFCQPRDLLAVDFCPAPSIPRQCPDLFPGSHRHHR